MNWAAMEVAKTTRKPAIRYLTYSPNPLCEISKFSSGLARLDPLDHSPMERMTQQKGIPRSAEPTALVHALPRGAKRA